MSYGRNSDANASEIHASFRPVKYIVFLTSEESVTACVQMHYDPTRDATGSEATNKLRVSNPNRPAEIGIFAGSGQIDLINSPVAAYDSVTDEFQIGDRPASGSGIELFESALYDTFDWSLPLVRDLQLTWVDVLEQASARGFSE